MLVPAFATGGLLFLFTVITTCLEVEFAVPSLTTSEKVYCVVCETCGAINVGIETVDELSVIPEGAVHL